MTSFGSNSQPVSSTRGQQESVQDDNNKLLVTNSNPEDLAGVASIAPSATNPQSLGDIDLSLNEQAKHFNCIQNLQNLRGNHYSRQTATTANIRRVCWFQDVVSLTFDIYHIRQIKNWYVDINEAEDCFSFFAQSSKKLGTTNKYQFSLNLYSKVLDNPVFLPSKNKFRLVLYKRPSCFGKWPRLTRNPNDNPVWLSECQADDDACVEEDLGTDDELSDLSNSVQNIHLIEKNSNNDYQEIDHLSEFKQQSKSRRESNDTGERINRFLEEQDQYLFNCTRRDARFEGRQQSTSYNITRKTSIRIDYKNNDPRVDIFNPFNRRDQYTIKKIRGTKMSRSSVSDTSSVRSKNMVRNALDFKRTYLFVYNLIMFIMFLMVYLILIIKTISGQLDDDSVQGAAHIIKLLTYAQLLESIHPLLGLVPGGPFMPFLQTFGRLVVNHFLSEPTIRINSAPYAGHLFIVWSSIEIFRYSFYALRVFKLDIYPLTWCRYTLFMPLYPMGGLFESMVLLSAIDYYSLTGEYSISLPNKANFSFNLPMFLKFYIFILLGPSIMHLMKYMLNQRRKQLKIKEA